MGRFRPKTCHVIVSQEDLRSCWPARRACRSGAWKIRAWRARPPTRAFLPLLHHGPRFNCLEADVPSKSRPKDSKIEPRVRGIKEFAS